MKNILTIFEIVLAVSLITSIIIQPKGQGLGGVWGGGGEFYKSRRGVEKIVFYLTIILACLFFLNSSLLFIFQ